MNHTTPQVIYQPVTSSRASGLPKLKLTEFLGDPLEWQEWSGLFDVVVHQKPISDTEKMQYLKTSLMGQAKAALSGMGFGSQSHYHAWDILCEKYGRSDVKDNAPFKKIHTHPSIRHDDRQVCKCDYKCGEHLDSTWIHIRPRIRRRAKFNNEKTFSATEKTMVAVYARPLTTERQLDYFQRVACLQSRNSREPVSTDKLVV